MPCDFAAQPDSESTPLLGVLARVNRLGFFTEQSQPGVPIVGGSGQRAFVAGYCSESVAKIVGSNLLSSELVVIMVRPGQSGAAQVCVTVESGNESTCVCIFGTSAEAADAYFEDTRSGAFGSLLADSWQLHIFDPQWGRNDLLWESLLDAMPATDDGSM